MDLEQELRDLAAEGSDASVSLMRDLVLQNPQHASTAIKLWTDIGTDEAEHAIFLLMKEFPATLGTEGIQALGEINNDNGLADICNFISLVEMDGKTRFLLMMDALDVLHESDHKFSDQISANILDMHWLVPGLRIDVLRERAKEGEEKAVDEIGKIATLFLFQKVLRFSVSMEAIRRWR